MANTSDDVILKTNREPCVKYEMRLLFVFANKCLLLFNNYLRFDRILFEERTNNREAYVRHAVHDNHETFVLVLIVTFF